MSHGLCVRNGLVAVNVDEVLNEVGGGAPGASAYEVWLAAGNVGTVEQYLASLIGSDGAAGATGNDGADGAAGADGADGLQGPQGDPGEQGPAGDVSTCWPIGSVFISVVSTNPATLLGFGTWSAFAAGRCLVGLDSGQTEFDTVEETGGAKTVTLTANEMPSHTHTQDAHTHTQNSHNHTQDAHQHGLSEGTTDGSGTFMDRSNAAAATTAVTDLATATNQAATATNQNATATNQNTGGGGAHSNLQPYIVVYMWKRTA